MPCAIWNVCVLCNVYVICNIETSIGSFLWICLHELTIALTCESCLLYMSHVSDIWVMSLKYESRLFYYMNSRLRSRMSHVSYTWVMSLIYESCLFYYMNWRLRWLQLFRGNSQWNAQKFEYMSDNILHIYMTYYMYGFWQCWRCRQARVPMLPADTWGCLGLPLWDLNDASGSLCLPEPLGHV